MHKLTTPPIYHLATSPVGILFETRLFDTFCLKMLGVEFAIRRAAAAARVTVGGSLNDFLRELRPTGEVPPRARQRIGAARFAFERAWRACEDMNRRWDEAFWSARPPASDELVRIETQRRIATEPCVTGRRHFGFLGWARFAPIARFEVPTPAEVHATYAKELADPDLLYRAPDAVPEVEASARVPGPSGMEYLVRFRSPSTFTNDVASARVYEPARIKGALPTLVFGDGMCMHYDQEVYWPAEESLGRRLSARGWRVILVASPWHGRRTPLGRYSGEAYLARLPVTAFQLFSAQAREAAVLIEWARCRGASGVVLGGMSLGAMLACQVAGRCGSWPESMRPDIVAPVAFSCPVHKLLATSALGHILGIDRQFKATGWTEAELERLNPLLSPPDSPAVPPERILPFLGSRDNVTPYPLAVEALKRWNVPDRNVTVWNAGHIGVAVILSRRSVFQDAIAKALSR